MQTVTEQTNSLSAKLNRVVWCHDFKIFTKTNLEKVFCQYAEMKRENLSRKTMSSVAHNVLHICDGRAFKLKCNLGKRIIQPLKSRQTETNCTPIANVLLAAAKSSTNFRVSRKLQVYFCRPEIEFVKTKPCQNSLWNCHLSI